MYVYCDFYWSPAKKNCSEPHFLGCSGDAKYLSRMRQCGTREISETIRKFW